MKYLPLRDIDDVTSALNFDTADCRVVGSCDLYTTKAAGSDKKLYKNIEQSLEVQYESLLRFSASLSPPQASSAAASLNLSRSSPFGPLSQISSRRTFAYLIATLNASHPDYDFSQMRPRDFRRERSLKLVMNTLDATLYNLRPKPPAPLLNGPKHWTSSVTPSGPSTPSANQRWNPRMWRAINKEMDLRECSVYSFDPEEDSYDGEDGSIWSFNYFFFNKTRKRVCYVYLRGLSVMAHSPMLKATSAAKRSVGIDRANGGSLGASKRANYWLGDLAPAEAEADWDEDGDDDIISLGDQDEDDGPRLEIENGEGQLSRSKRTTASPDNLDGDSRFRSPSAVRGFSEEVAEKMEV